MNERVLNGKTPEDRMAAVARTLVMNMQQALGRTPDYADFRDTLRPFIRRELIRARVDEARTSGSHAVTSRVRELTMALMNIEVECADVMEGM